MTPRSRPTRAARRSTSRPLFACACAAAGLTFAAGCLVGPNYRPPDARVQAGWASLGTRPSGPAATQVSTATADRANTALWWRNFNDPVLDELVTEALASNLDVAQAVARLRQARAQRRVAAGQFYPAVDLSGSYRRSGTGRDNDRNGGGSTTNPTTGAPIITGALGTTASRSNDQFQLGFDAAWELDVFGGLRRGVEAADASIRAGVADLQNVRLTLVSEVAVNYFALRGAQQRLAFAERNLQIQQRSLEVTRRQFAGGIVSGLDLAQAEAQIASTQSQIPALEQAARVAIFDLALLLGREPATLVDPLTAAGPIPATAAPAVPAGLPSDLLRRRPDVRRAEAQLHAAVANIGVATADLFPRFTLTGTFGTEDQKVRRLFNWGNTIWSFGPNISWNVFDLGGRIRGNIALTEAQRDEAFFAYRQTVLIALRDAEQALTAYDFEQRRRVGLRAAVGANRRSVDLSQRLYAQGQTEFVNVLTAQQALLGSEDALVQSDQQVAANLVAIYKALGGGWEYEAVPPPVAATQPAPATQPSAGGADLRSVRRLCAAR